ncbi:family 10 glycosylhydrolase [Paenibacillus abyssi]|nr:family 10 glycosylhydrolase [Paenibacillus abyssi]
MKVSKKLVLPILIMSLCLLSILSPIRANAAQDIMISLDGQRINSDVSPYIIPKVNVTMVPLRVISEGLGAIVTWSQTTRTVTISGKGSTISMTNGQTEAVVNGSRVKLDNSVQIRQGRVMVPIRFVSVHLGLQVIWNQKERSISLKSKTAVPTVPDADVSGMRGAWVSAVYNLDWPTSKSYGNEEQQKEDYKRLLDDLQGMGINAVFVQIRPAADALYPSLLVPWSAYLTGVQGQAPSYDPLAFMIEETHRRGMEFHAWFNPFRAGVNADTSKLAENHVALQHPDWIVMGEDKERKKMPYINPGIPEARQHIIDTIMEVVNNYNIDGVHLDDYFYPSNMIFNDDAAFLLYNNRNVLDRNEWRRDNINQFVRQLGESIHKAKPNVEYGISPFGVWRNSSVDPTGSDTRASVTAYDSMHADVRTWIRNGWIDYVAPQLYWSMTFSPARYDKLADWWANEVKGTSVDLYIGHSPYKLGKEAGWESSQEIINQLRYNQIHPEIKGDIFFRAENLRSNPLGLIEALRTYYEVK